MSNISWKERARLPRCGDLREVGPGMIEVDHARCTGCAQCVRICPVGALLLEEMRCRMKPPEENDCFFCGACMAICQADAIRLVSPNFASGYFKTIGQGSPKLPRLSEEDWT